MVGARVPRAQGRPPGRHPTARRLLAQAATVAALFAFAPFLLPLLAVSTMPRASAVAEISPTVRAARIQSRASCKSWIWARRQEVPAPTGPGYRHNLRCLTLLPHPSGLHRWGPGPPTGQHGGQQVQQAGGRCLRSRHLPSRPVPGLCPLVGLWAPRPPSRLQRLPELHSL